MNATTKNTPSTLSKFSLGYELDKSWVEVKHDINKRTEK